MRASFFVVFDRQGFVNAYKTDRFQLGAGQYATEIVIEVPEEAFAPMRLPVVQVSLPVEALRRTYEASIQEETE